MSTVMLANWPKSRIMMMYSHGDVGEKYFEKLKTGLPPASCLKMNDCDSDWLLR